MWDYLYKYLIIIVSSMVKFVAGPILGAQFKFPFLLTAVLTIAGMMISVILFTSILGKIFHRWMMRTFFKNRRLFTKGNRRKVKIWKKYGMPGVAFLTPVLFTPIGGAMIASGFGEAKEKIFLYMLVSAVFWGVVISFLVTELSHLPIFQ
jgi:hypothetical protein